MGIYRQRTFSNFDESEPMVAGRQMELGEHTLQGGDPIPDDVDPGIRRRLWMVEHAHYAKDWTPTPEQPLPDLDPGEPDASGVSYAHTGGGWYQVTAPGLDEPLKVKGEDAAKEAAEKLRTELRDKASQPSSTEGEGGEDNSTGE